MSARAARWLTWLPILLVLATSSIAWGVHSARLDAAERKLGEHAAELGEIKRDYVTGREFRAINERLARIESGMDELTRYFRRPQP